jgi:tetratricopeptide (TPR) repeat protein
LTHEEDEMRNKLLYLIGFASCLHAGVAAASSGSAAGVATETKTAVVAPQAACNIETYEQAVKAEPASASAHNQLGICLQRNLKFKEALAEYREALKVNSNYAEVWNNMGTLSHSQRKYKQAIKSYQKALEIKPEMATAAKNLGTARLAMGRIEQAYEAYELAYRLDPGIFDVTTSTGFVAQGNLPMQYYYIAKLNAVAGRLDAALDFLSKAQAAGFRDFDKVRSDPAFKAIVTDSRFVALSR